MRKCKFEELIDNYLLNRLDEGKKSEFEEHYFNCPSCFEKMVERDKLISIVKDEGDMIFQDEYMAEEAKGVSWFQKIVSLLTPKQWAAAAVSACLLLLIGFGLIYFHNPKPSFRIDSYDVRGAQIKIKIKFIPPADIRIEWSKSAEDAEYEISINNNGDRVWSASEKIKDNFMVLPEEAKTRIKLDKKYFCEVKAFSSQGRLAAFGKTEFKIQKIQ